MIIKFRKKALAVSVASIMLCVVMLIASTFAWFSDVASTGDVTITAGNLDVDIVQANLGGDSTYTPGKSLENGSLFDDGIEKVLWEPGMMVKGIPFMIQNKGTLALKYKLYVNAKAKENSEINLLDVIKYKVVKAQDFELSEKDATLAQRQETWDDITEKNDMVEGVILPTTPDLSSKMPEKSVYSEGNTDALLIVLFWNPNESTSTDINVNTDNKYNIKDGEKLTATFQVELKATQTPAEEDSFGPDYDSNAFLPGQEKVAIAKKDEEMQKNEYAFRLGNDVNAILDPNGKAYSKRETGGKNYQYDLLKVLKENPIKGNQLVLINDYIFEQSNLTDTYFEQETIDNEVYDIDLNGHELQSKSLFLHSKDKNTRPGNSYYDDFYETPFDFALSNGTFESPSDGYSNINVVGAKNVDLTNLTLTTKENKPKMFFNRAKEDSKASQLSWGPSGTNFSGPVGLIKLRMASSDPTNVNVNKVTAKYGCNVIYSSNPNSTVTIKDSTFAGSYLPELNDRYMYQADAEALWISGGKVTITNTVIEEKVLRLENVKSSELNKCTIKAGMTLTGSNGKITLTDCNFTGGKLKVGGSKISIVSGTYCFNPTQYKASTSKVTKNDDGTWTVTAQ